MGLSLRRSCCCAAAALALQLPALGAAARPNFVHLSLEELSRMVIISAAKREQRLGARVTPHVEIALSARDEVTEVATRKAIGRSLLLQLALRFL